MPGTRWQRGARSPPAIGTRQKAGSSNCAQTTRALMFSEVAKQYGGGGHRNASGFKVSFAAAVAFEV